MIFMAWAMKSQRDHICDESSRGFGLTRPPLATVPALSLAPGDSFIQ